MLLRRPELRDKLSGVLASKSDEAAGGADGPRTQFAIFSSLLAIAILFARAHFSDWALVSSDTVVSLAAIFVLL